MSNICKFTFINTFVLKVTRERKFNGTLGKTESLILHKTMVMKKENYYKSYTKFRSAFKHHLNKNKKQALELLGCKQKLKGPIAMYFFPATSS